MAIIVVGTSTYTSDLTTGVVDIPVTASAGDGILLGFAWRVEWESQATITSIVWNPSGDNTPLTKVDEFEYNSSDTRAAVYYLPEVTTAATSIIRITWSKSASTSGFVSLLRQVAGHNASDMLRRSAKVVGSISSSAPLLSTIDSSSDDLVVDFFAGRLASASVFSDSGVSDTQKAESNGHTVASSVKAGSATTTTGYGSTQPTSYGAGVIQLSVKSAAGGPPPQGTVTISAVDPGETTAEITYSYDDTDETGFEYRIDGGTAVSIGASPATITGLTASTEYDIEVRAINAVGAGAWSAVSSFSTSAAGHSTTPTLTGSVSFSSITQTSYTASWPAGSDNVAVTGYEYQIGSTAGAWTDAGNSLSAAITGRTAGATETVYVRAYDAVGLRSTPAISGSVTLESALAAGINVTEPLKNNTGTVLASQSGIRVAVLQAADLVSVHEATGLTTNASGILATISDAAITTGQQYHVAIKLADGSVGITGPITAS